MTVEILDTMVLFYICHIITKRRWDGTSSDHGHYINVHSYNTLTDRRHIVELLVDFCHYYYKTLFFQVISNKTNFSSVFLSAGSQAGKGGAPSLSQCSLLAAFMIVLLSALTEKH